VQERRLPDELPDELATLWYLIRNAARQMDRQGEALCQRELGISQALFLVLSVVDAFPGPLSQQAVADRLGLTKGTVSRQIEHAVAAGLMTVSVAPHTRRENVLALTGAGTALVRRGDALMETSRVAMLGAIDPQDLPAALRLLGRVVESLA
jgi:DNA-binding MarR family transcriptional regulator